MEELQLFESGSGVNENFTKFSCALSLLSDNEITNETYWTLRESIADGGIAIAVILSLILCVSFGWNLFIIVAYIIKYKLLKEPANILLFSLAVTDILVGVMLIPSSIVTGATGQFQLGRTDVFRCRVCSIDGFSFVFLSLLTLYILTLLSIDRFLLLRYPIKYKQYGKAWHAATAIAITAVLSFITALLPICQLGFGEYEFNRQIGLCLPRWTPRNNLYYVGVPLLQAFVLITVIASTNVWTYKIVSMVLKAKFMRSSFRASTKEEATQYRFKHSKQQRQIVKVFGILLIIYIISWIPVFVMFITVFITEGNGIPAWIYTVCLFLFLSNPFIHPIIETFFIQKLRMEVGRVRRSVRTLSTRLTEKFASFDALKGIDIPHDLECPEKANTSEQIKSNIKPTISTMSLAVPAHIPSVTVKTITRSNTLP